MKKNLIIEVNESRGEMKTQDIHLLYEYNYWANKRILAVSANVSHEQFDATGFFPYGGLRGTLLHILDTEWGWRALFQNIDSASDLLESDFPTLAALEARW